MNKKQFIEKYGSYVDSKGKLITDVNPEFENDLDQLINSQWINIKDELPKNDDYVLAADSCAIEIAYYNRYDDIWYADEFVNSEWIDKITHWQPLPKPPKE